VAQSVELLRLQPYGSPGRKRQQRDVLARQQAQAALVEVLTPIHVENFNKSYERARKASGTEEDHLVVGS
jgi:hypothetical protein